MSIVDYIRAIDDGDNVWRENNCGRIKSRLVYNGYEGGAEKFSTNQLRREGGKNIHINE